MKLAVSVSSHGLTSNSHGEPNRLKLLIKFNLKSNLCYFLYLLLCALCGLADTESAKSPGNEIWIINLTNSRSKQLSNHSVMNKTEQC